MNAIYLTSNNTRINSIRQLKTKMSYIWHYAKYKFYYDHGSKITRTKNEIIKFIEAENFANELVPLNKIQIKKFDVIITAEKKINLFFTLILNPYILLVNRLRRFLRKIFGNSVDDMNLEDLLKLLKKWFKSNKKRSLLGIILQSSVQLLREIINIGRELLGNPFFRGVIIAYLAAKFVLLVHLLLEVFYPINLDEQFVEVQRMYRGLYPDVELAIVGLLMEYFLARSTTTAKLVWVQMHKRWIEQIMTNYLTEGGHFRGLMWEPDGSLSERTIKFYYAKMAFYLVKTALGSKKGRKLRIPLKLLGLVYGADGKRVPILDLLNTIALKKLTLNYTLAVMNLTRIGFQINLFNRDSMTGIELLNNVATSLPPEMDISSLTPNPLNMIYKIYKFNKDNL
jgi:hypothetical protein